MHCIYLCCIALYFTSYFTFVTILRTVTIRRGRLGAGRLDAAD